MKIKKTVTMLLLSFLLKCHKCHSLRVRVCEIREKKGDKNEKEKN